MDDTDGNPAGLKAFIVIASVTCLMATGAAQVQVGPSTSTTHPDINLTINFTATANYTSFETYPDNITLSGSNFSLYHTASPPNETVVEMPWYNATPSGVGNVTDVVVEADAGSEMHVIATDLQANRDYRITHDGTTIFEEENSDGAVSATFTMNSSADTLTITKTSSTGGADRGNWTRVHDPVGGEVTLNNGTFDVFLGPGDAVDAEVTVGGETRSFVLQNGTTFVDVSGMEGETATVFLDLQNDTVSTETPRVDGYVLQATLSDNVSRVLDLGPIVFVIGIIAAILLWFGLTRA